MQNKPNKTYFTLKISTLILLVLLHFSLSSKKGVGLLTQLIQRYNLDDKLIEIGNSISSLI